MLLQLDVYIPDDDLTFAFETLHASKIDVQKRQPALELHTKNSLQYLSDDTVEKEIRNFLPEPYEISLNNIYINLNRMTKQVRTAVM